MPSNEGWFSHKTLALSPAEVRVQKGKETIARTIYYDQIAKKWHRLTGYHGGPFKRYVLNDRILQQIPGIAGNAILELGAGNGYFVPMLLRRFSGQLPSRLVITDQSSEQLDIAQSNFFIDGAEYEILDVSDPFPFPDQSFHLILASMLFNELITRNLEQALKECSRVLAKGGQLIAAVPHPDFVHSLSKKGALTDFGHGLFAMPGAGGLRLPVSRRPLVTYLKAMQDSGFIVETEDLYPDEKTLNEKSGLTISARKPLGLLFKCSLPE
ncbi:class I SAM-dependent methyltransferase [Ktedonospora formicarum]|uniref:class I SAM-dependent methyltransferase n=1 Tax=Ktedonospora formicarum TaxID=2778364 RepID=UPI001C68DED2|nr:class I SAM-dependent methyltransferase [Ktedonospora formicarum]